MKKLLVFLGILGLFSFTSVSSGPGPYAPSKPSDISTSIVHYDGMEYRVFVVTNIGLGGVATGVINVTKERLEVQKLKLEISKLRK